MFGLKLAIRNCYKLNKFHMIVAPPMNDEIIATVVENKYNSNVQHVLHFFCNLYHYL